jgi:intraflagellar transport protein 56
VQVLSRLDPDPGYFEGKRGACLGFCQLLAAGDASAPPDKLPEVLTILKDSPDGAADGVVQTLTSWATSNGMLR